MQATHETKRKLLGQMVTDLSGLLAKTRSQAYARKVRGSLTRASALYILECSQRKKEG